jgi:signal transduction histidine kinase
VHWSIEDDARSLWLLMPCGLVRIARPELDAWAAAADQGMDAKRTIQTTVFDSYDGVGASAFAGGYKPRVTKSRDGRVWFGGADGVSVVDPRHLAVNTLPPPVHVEGIIADRTAYGVTTGALRLPPRVRDLQIDYTALSLAAPEKVRFRYKLEGWDRDWQDAGTRRQAFYGNLPPREYRFRVIACNNSGVWNETGDSLDLSIAPAYYQATWFRIASLAAFLMILAALYQLRLRQVAQRVRLRTEARLEERERIARDLHDTLLQSVQGLILQFHAAARGLPEDEPVRQRLEKTLDLADQVLAEGRDRVRDLRAAPLALGDLPAAFQRIAEQTPQHRRATFKTVVEGRARELQPLVLEEVYCIGREAIINSLAHSECLGVEVEITYDARQFRLRVRDDGRGIDSAILEQGGRPGHWGLQGMRERAQRIGAQLQFWSRPGTGTEVELTVPAAAAYRTPDGQGTKA